MAYTVVFSNRAQKDIASLDTATAARIVAKIEQLATAPHQMPGVKHLKGDLKGVYRIRTGDYRILYQLQDKVLIVFIVAIGNRKDIYE